MIVLVDANVIISALLKDSTTRRILFFSGMRFATIDFAVREIEKHSNELRERTGLDSEAYDRALGLILSKIEIMNDSSVKDELKQAKEVMTGVDPDDSVYVALGMHLESSIIWSDDKHFKKQKRVRVFTTAEIIRMFHQIGFAEGEI